MKNKGQRRWKKSKHLPMRNYYVIRPEHGDAELKKDLNMLVNRKITWRVIVTLTSVSRKPRNNDFNDVLAKWIVTSLWNFRGIGMFFHFAQLSQLMSAAVRQSLSPFRSSSKAWVHLASSFVISASSYRTFLQCVHFHFLPHPDYSLFWFSQGRIVRKFPISKMKFD